MINNFATWFFLFCLGMGSAYGRNVPSKDYHSYKTEHGIELQFTDQTLFVNVLRDGKLVWRQFLAINGARLRPNEERRFYFEDVDHNGITDFYYVFENYVGTAEQMRPDTFWTHPVEKQEKDGDFDPFRDTKSSDFAFFICYDMGSNCALIRYQAEGKCVDESGYNFQLCEKYRGKDEREKMTVEISTVWGETEWGKMLNSFGRKYMAPGIVEDIRYALANGNVSLIKIPEMFKPLEPWATTVKTKSAHAILYQGPYGNSKLGAYLIAGDEAEVLDRQIGSMSGKYYSRNIVPYKLDKAAFEPNRLLIRYKGKQTITIGWINSTDVIPTTPTSETPPDR